ncbi:hypothetical protein Q4489_03830 [Thalassotalea sp. 1_MG-2023]|uniref:hypothetical protein n=1 Tax=Thalassotalea sp. 1_MG-2023 TaxID=3062680 RepID=UPI0026E37A49|nr:hypothetical protein [Thalassotalea sp. 1_MG-2023]MDO6426125.1 hypothetical protein [Thalassotalea sp. 1_MG-2023]
MNKSIESMWKEGFINEPNLSVPKVNALYNRKSQNIVDKLQSMFALNIKALIIGCIIMMIMMSLIGAPFLGLYICCLLIPLVIIAKKELTKSTALSKGQSSYDYLVNFDHWLKSSISTYAVYYRFFYPLLFIGMVTQALVSKAGGQVIAFILKLFPTDIVLLGVPYYLIVILTILFLVIIKYSDALYRLDLNIVYGHQFKKLDELLADMKTLRG